MRIADIRFILHVGLPVQDGFSHKAAREAELGLDQDGLFRRKMLRSASSELTGAIPPEYEGHELTY